jgi:hypothetical protein
MWHRKSYTLKDTHLLVIMRVRAVIGARTDSQAVRYILNRVQVGQGRDAPPDSDGPGTGGVYRHKNYNLEDSHLLALARARYKLQARSDSAALRGILERVVVPGPDDQ